MGLKASVLIIGSGQAGAMVAITLRRIKYEGSIVIVGSEKYLPYQRPPLSKAFLTNATKLDNLYIKSKSYYQKKNIEILSGTTVINIDRKAKKVALEDKTEYRYKKLIIATGSELNKIPLNCDTTNIHYLRTIDDSLAIKKAIDKEKDITIIGAGYIGLEIAATAIKKGCKVTVIELTDRVMSRSISSLTSDFLQKKHEKEGVNFLFNKAVFDIQNLKKGERILCNDGHIIDTNTVIIGVGIQPNIKLAIDSALDFENGITVNEDGQTSDPNIFSVGDCTNHPNKIYNKRIRLESVHNAVEQAKTIAHSIVGKKRPYQQVPWFWSDQYNLKLQIAGIPINYNDIIFRGSQEKEKFAVFYLKKNKIIALEAINDQKSFLIGKKLIKNQTNIPLDVLKEQDSDLKSFLD